MAAKVKENNPLISPFSYKKNQIGKDTDKRFRWDLFWASVGLIKIEKPNFVNDMYKYLNDDHLDTAMKKIVKELY